VPTPGYGQSAGLVAGARLQNFEEALCRLEPAARRRAESLIARRSPAVLAGIVAGVALLLAAVGTYGVLSYTIAQRRREIGVRMALGAQTHHIRTQFLSLGLRLLAAGILLCVVGAWAAGKGMEGVLFGVPKRHVATLLGTALVMTAVSLSSSASFLGLIRFGGQVG